MRISSTENDGSIALEVIEASAVKLLICQPLTTLLLLKENPFPGRVMTNRLGLEGTPVGLSVTDNVTLLAPGI